MVVDTRDVDRVGLARAVDLLDDVALADRHVAEHEGAVVVGGAAVDLLHLRLVVDDLRGHDLAVGVGELELDVRLGHQPDLTGAAVGVDVDRRTRRPAGSAPVRAVRAAPSGDQRQHHDRSRSRTTNLHNQPPNAAPNGAHAIARPTRTDITPSSVVHRPGTVRTTDASNNRPSVGFGLGARHGGAARPTLSRAARTGWRGCARRRAPPHRARPRRRRPSTSPAPPRSAPPGRGSWPPGSAPRPSR